MARISAGRRARQRRALLVAAGLLSALVMLVSGGAWALTSYINDHLGRVNAGTAGTPSSGPLNILVAGLDERTGLTRRQQALLHVGAAPASVNTDTLMLVHVPADHRFVQVVSLPRDSWVNIPGHGMNKINAALGLGGPQLMVQTVEQATGLTINDYVEVNFLGFVKVIDALGGVNICLPYAVNDPYSGLHMSAGMHHVNGITALEFARDRHSFADLRPGPDPGPAAADLLRAQRGHQLRDAGQPGPAGELPVRGVRRDPGGPGLQRGEPGRRAARDLAAATSRSRPCRWPTPTTMTPTGESAVLWNTSAAAALFNELKTDQPPAAPATRPAAGGGAKPHGPRPQPGVAGRLQRDADRRAVRRHRAASWPRSASGCTGRASTGPARTSRQTVIQYPAGQKASAQLVRAGAARGDAAAGEGPGPGEDPARPE